MKPAQAVDLIVTGQEPLCRLPMATYRLQIGDLGFAGARNLVLYLHQLGVSDCYVSPLLEVVSRDTHGYDVARHDRLNAALGTEEEYREFVSRLREHGMGLIFDVVPNHMGIAGGRNPWWSDVLENGPASPYSGYFDIEWDPPLPELRDKVLLPILGDQYGRILENQELLLERRGGEFVIRYHDTALPVAPETFAQILEFRREALEARLAEGDPHGLELWSIVTALSHLPSRTDTQPDRRRERTRESVIIKRRLATLMSESSAVRAFIDENVARFNGVKSQPDSFDALDALLGAQAYRLCFWQVAADEINYRRFFDINTLAAIRMEEATVFEEAHRLIFQLVREGGVTGLRIDHPDGLYAPAEYLRQLQRRCAVALHEAGAGLEGAGEDARRHWREEVQRELDRWAADHASARLVRPFYVVVEKILMAGERLPAGWPIWGTTGYDFLNALNGIFVHRAAERAMTDTYARFIGERPDLREIAYDAKRLIIDTSMSSEISVLGRRLARISERHRASRDFTTRSLTTALREIIASFPVYRTYIDGTGVTDRDRWYVDLAVALARRRNPATSGSVFEFIADVLQLRFPGARSEAERQEQLAFVGKFQQLTGPITAKGLEDTAFYRYHRLLSLNEVGGAPERFGIPVTEFHRLNAERRDSWPAALLATSTHDTKRSEDVRARLNVLSELPREWRRHVHAWRRANRPKRQAIEGQPVPDANEEYMLYQTLVGAWPLAPPSTESLAAFVERVQRFMVKALREAKVHSSWISPAPEYERAVTGFIAAILDPRLSRVFLRDFEAFQGEIARRAVYGALAQTLLKLTAPGVPDVYQGTELWDFSLADPDNRRPVDFALRARLLEELRADIARGGDLAGVARALVEAPADGRVKLFVIHRALALRRERPRLFLEGAYRPLQAHGPRADHVCAFARVLGAQSAIALVPRLLAVGGFCNPPLGTAAWGEDSGVTVSPDEGTRFRNLFTDERVEAVGGRLPLARAFASFPVALLVRET